MLKTLCFMLAACVAGGAAAQTAARPDPADPKAAVPARPYESAFKGYRPYVDPEVTRWRQSNEEVGRLGGHVGHVPKAQGPAVKPAAQGGHGSHK
jgi:hypothetical protein